MNLKHITKNGIVDADSFDDWCFHNDVYYNHFQYFGWNGRHLELKDNEYTNGKDVVVEYYRSEDEYLESMTHIIGEDKWDEWYEWYMKSDRSGCE